MDKWRDILNKRELPIIDENKKRKSIEILKMEIANTEITVKESYFEKIKRYIPFMSKITFLFQFVLLLVGILVIRSMTFEKTRLLEIMELEKSFKYNMYEIEMSCKMDLKELISIKLIINTIINLCIMTIFAVATGTHFEQESYVLILYFLVPFMITNVTNIVTMRLLKHKSNETVNMTIMLLINAILFILNIKFPSVYETSSVLVWLGLLIITVFYFIKAVYRFFEEEDDYIWNLQ